MRTCRICGVAKPLEEFPRSKKNYRRWQCAPCYRRVSSTRRCARNRKNPAIRYASYERWRQKNKHVKAALTMAYRVRKFQQTPPWADLQAIKEIYKRAAMLTAQTGVPHHVDHIYPLKSKFVCGLHVEANLQILPGALNVRKSNKLTLDMLEPRPIIS